MSGHSKWHNIQAKKGKADAARGKIFTKLGRELLIATKEGGYMRDNGIELSEGLAVYGYSICSAIVTNCVKLVPLSQLAGQKILGESFELISSASEKALFTDINDIGISGSGFDLRAMQHERLYSRQYMS